MLDQGVRATDDHCSVWAPDALLCHFVVDSRQLRCVLGTPDHPRRFSGTTSRDVFEREYELGIGCQECAELLHA